MEGKGKTMKKPKAKARAERLDEELAAGRAVIRGNDRKGVITLPLEQFEALQKERDDLRAKLGYAQEQIKHYKVENGCMSGELIGLKDGLAHVATEWASCVVANKHHRVWSNHNAADPEIPF